MIYNIAVKGFRLSDKKLKYIDRHVKKITRFISDIDINLPLFDIIIKKQKEKRLDHGRERTPIDSKTVIVNVIPKTKSATYYDGRILLRLPKRILVVHFYGNTIEEAIYVGFERLTKKVETYEGKHFPNDSEYYNRDSIRK